MLNVSGGNSASVLAFLLLVNEIEVGNQIKMATDAKDNEAGGGKRLAKNVTLFIFCCFQHSVFQLLFTPSKMYNTCTG